MRSKAIFQNTKKENKKQRRYGLHSFKIPPPGKEITAFESELVELVKKMKFC